MIRPLFALTATLVLVGIARPAEDPPGPKIDFPDVKGLTRGKIQTFPKAELGYSVGYNAPGFNATVYVYNLGLKKIPDGPKSDEAKAQMKQATADLETVRQAGVYKSVKELGMEETIPLGKGKDAPTTLRRRFELELNSGVKLSEIYVTGYKDHFVKIRISHDPDDKAAPEKIATLLEELGKSLK